MCGAYIVLIKETINLLGCSDKTMKNKLFSLPSSLIMHFVIGWCPLEMEFPHSLNNMSVVEYVNDWIDNGEIMARKNVIKALDMYRQRVSVGVSATSCEENNAVLTLEVLLGRR